MKNLVRLLPFLGLMLAGCAQPHEAPQAAEPATQKIVVPAAPPLTVPPLSRLWQTNRPVIYQGDMRMRVANFTAATARLDTLLHQHGAYLSEAHENSEDGRHTQQLTIRVPSARFLPLTFALGQVGYVEQKDISSRDLTSEHLQVWVQDTITQRISARDQLLAEEATMGTLNLYYYQLVPVEMSPQPPLAPRLAAGLRFGGYLLGEAAVTLTYLWPLTLLLLGWLLYRWRRLATK